MKIKAFAAAALAIVLCSCGNSLESADGVTSGSPDSAAATVTAVKEPQSPESSLTADADTTTTTTTATTTTTTTTTAADEGNVSLVTTKTPEDQSYYFQDGFVVAYSGTPQMRAMEQYFFNESAASALASNVSSYAKSVGKNTNVYLMVTPTAQEFYNPEGLIESTQDQSDCTLEIYSNLNGATGVFVNNILRMHKAQYLYSRTDFHWQPLAAYYSSKVFAETAGVDFPLLDTYEMKKREGFLGGFYTLSGISALAQYPDDFTYFCPANMDKLTVTVYDRSFKNGYESSLIHEDYSVDSSYMMFGTDDAIIEVDTDVKNDRVLVVFKDSYGNALTPFLTQSFSKIYVCDNRFFEINSLDFAKKVGATDVLFAFNASSAGNSDRVALIKSLMQQ